MSPTFRSRRLTWWAARIAPALILGACATPGEAQQPSAAAQVDAAPTVSFAEMAALAEAADVVATVTIRDQAVVEAERAPGLAAGKARLYLEAATEALLAGRSGMGEALTFIADVPLRPDGKAPPRLRSQRFLVFADPVASRAGMLQLVAPAGLLPATPGNERLARTVIGALAAADAPPRITGVRDVMSVAGNLAGESETQLFFDTQRGAPVSVTVIRRPGMDPQWGVSWSEIVDQAARPPVRDTLAWYRLACFVPAQVPATAFLQTDRAARIQAEADYRYVLEQLGPCPRLPI